MFARCILGSWEPGVGVTPLIPLLRKQRQASLDYTASSRPARGPSFKNKISKSRGRKDVMYLSFRGSTLPSGHSG